ncbi:hypothetical protein [Gordonia sp. MMO-8]|uniref:hypothetical protein n=1 Tax=Gordonia sp. MMO-8 TaxID=3127886 RepID=UPI003019AD99
MGKVIKGPWPDLPANKREWPPPGFKRGGLGSLSDTEARRSAILHARPKCSVCEVPFALNIRIPDDRVCRACRRDMEANTTPDDPALF